ncbi:MAG: replication initiation protein [Ruminococcus flavefaciens]|nr:replication initiation protein [Ruminococcus flavefaciens]
MKRIVKYDNHMNELRFSDFTQVDLDFFMTLCSLMKGQDTNEFRFTFHELRKMSGYTKSNSIKKFAEDLEQMNEHLMKVNCKLKTGTRTVMFVLFPTFDIDTGNQVLKVSVNTKFQFLLNEITKNFTKPELNEFLSLSSKYSKNLYRLLKQSKATGVYQVSINDFREKIGCPDTYASKYIMDKIIKPSINELNSKAYFQGLKCTPQYENKRGRPLKGYVFVFEPDMPHDGVDMGKEGTGNK